MELPQHPVQKMDTLLAQMARSRHIARRSVSSKLLDHLERQAFSAGVLGFLMGTLLFMILDFIQPPAHGEVILSFRVCLVMGGLSGMTFYRIFDTGAGVQTVLMLFKRSLPITNHEAQRMGVWLCRYPSMSEPVAVWGSQNPDGCLNLADYNKIQRWVRRAKRLHHTTNSSIAHKDTQQ